MSRWYVLLGVALLTQTAPVFWSAKQFAGRYHMADGARVSWDLLLREDGTFHSLRFVGDPEHDRGQPTEGIFSVTNRAVDPWLILSKRWDTSLAILTPVQLGDRLYLLTNGERESFCVALAKGREPRASDIGEFLLRVGDWQKPPAMVTRPWFCP